MKITLRRVGENHDWPNYLFWGRMRTSTFALIVAFFFTSWLYQHYQPPAPAPAEEPAQIVPPGFVPDPEYTWVPRTNVQERPRYTTTTTTTTTTTEPTPTDSESPTTPTSSDTEPTTVVDPDGPGPLPATTTSTSPLLPVPNRSGTPTTNPSTTAIPGLGPVTTTPLAPG
ncbi:MAG: hypothetical protein QOJ80_1087 [Mycobacterium sp.]|nr:hypothetical protein [Mycobacterium sp.]